MYEKYFDLVASTTLVDAHNAVHRTGAAVIRVALTKNNEKIAKLSGNLFESSSSVMSFLEDLRIAIISQQLDLLD